MLVHLSFGLPWEISSILAAWSNLFAVLIIASVSINHALYRKSRKIARGLSNQMGMGDRHKFSRLSMMCVSDDRIDYYMSTRL